MKWVDLPLNCRGYLVCAYLGAVPIAALCFARTDQYPLYWFLLTAASFLVASINLRLPQLPTVLVSMGDVFTVLALLHFGPGPALITYWANILSSALTRDWKTHGPSFFRHIKTYRVAFNLACCAYSVYVMGLTYDGLKVLLGDHSYSYGIQVLSIALVWFFVNTGLLSVALALAASNSILTVWRKGLGLYLANFFGSTAAAGLIDLFYQRTDSSIVLLTVPLALVLYHLHTFYVEKDLQARRRIDDLNKMFIQTVETLATAVDAKDRYTHGHIRRVQVFAVEIARRIGITDESELMALKAGSLLHDIGKIAVPEYILNKPTSLTHSEYERMKLHPAVGSNMLKNIEFPYPVMPLVRSHHERWDGNGYPDRLSGDQIPMSARILAVADCYDALTTDRPYRSPMTREELIEFFQRESGKAYDPAVVDVLVSNIDEITDAGTEVSLAVKEDVWGIRATDLMPGTDSVRPLENQQPILTYGKALMGDSRVQSQLCSVFEFARADIQCITGADVLRFMGAKLEELIPFDAGAFYVADLEHGVVVAEHVLGKESSGLRFRTLRLEQKLSGWVAANNHSLFNVGAFPDFLGAGDLETRFEMSAIVPLNTNGVVLGAIALYRKERTKFSEQEYRRLELVGGQTSVALAKAIETNTRDPLFDTLTGLPNSYQLHLMFGQLVTDARKFDYSFAVVLVRLSGGDVELHLGDLLIDELIRTAANHLKSELRETDLLVRYSTESFLAVIPRMDRVRTEELKGRLQYDLGRLAVPVRLGYDVMIPVSIGVAMFPEDGTTLDSLIEVGAWRIRQEAGPNIAVPRLREATPVAPVSAVEVFLDKERA